MISEKGKEVIEHHRQQGPLYGGRHQGYAGYDPDLDDQPSDAICPQDNTSHDISQNIQGVSHNEMPDAAHTDDHR